MDRQNVFMNLHAKIALIALFTLGFLLGCGGTPRPFTLMDQNVRVKPGILSVISGDSSEPTEMLAQYLTQELKQRSTYRVVSQEEIKRRLGKYPVKLKYSFEVENKDKPVWLAKGEKNKLNAIEAQLKSDYLLVVWSTGLSRITTQNQRGGGSTTYSVGVVANLFEYPKASAIGFSDVSYNKGQTCCLYGKSEGEDIDELLKGSARDVAEKLSAATKMEKMEKQGK